CIVAVYVLLALIVWAGVLVKTLLCLVDAAGTLPPHATAWAVGVADGETLGVGVGVCVAAATGFLPPPRKTRNSVTRAPAAATPPTPSAMARLRRRRLRSAARRAASLASCRSRVFLLDWGMRDRSGYPTLVGFDHAPREAVQDVRLRHDRAVEAPTLHHVDQD